MTAWILRAEAVAFDPIVTHALNFVGRGALGLFQAGDGETPTEGRP